MTTHEPAELASVANVVPGEITRIRGTIGFIVVEPGDAAPALSASINDGTGTIEAIFMGRREIPGIEPGRVVTIQGRAAQGPEGLHIFNPWYQIEGPAA